MVDIGQTGLTSDVFAHRLLEEAYVASMSGTAFGSFGEGFIRLSYANSMDNLELGLERIRQFVSRL